MKETDNILNSLTFEEKVDLLTGVGQMSTSKVERLGVESKEFADGPHGIRKAYEENCVSFPNLCLAGATWDVELIKKLGIALAQDCIEHGVDMLLGPGVNIKRHILCGRNFEYFSEDPVLAGEMAAAYINGLQSLGVAASLKHFAANNQENNRANISVDADIRTLMEIYLKPFEIAVKKASPVSVMCAYNKIHYIWCSENRFLLTELLRDTWGYEGFVVSDWGAVHNPAKAIAAGLDMQMPANKNMREDISKGIENGEVTLEHIDNAARRMLKFLLSKSECKIDYNRAELHRTSREVAAAGIVLLKNDENTLPITKDKYKKVAVIGEFAKSPLINGQGSAEVLPWDENVESPYDEINKILGSDVELCYMEAYRKTSFSPKMLWPGFLEFENFIKDKDLVLMFIGSMESEDTEMFDRRTAEFNPNYEMFINYAIASGKKVVVVIQSGSAMILGEWRNKVHGIVQMWLGGESAGGAIADVLCGLVNPSGKLSETFPAKVRSDLEYPGNEHSIEYTEKLFVGYRYYDKHPEEIVYPFGHGLSYTDFEYADITVDEKENELEIGFKLKNIGSVDGAEVVQLYVGNSSSQIVKPIKELKAFDKIYLKAGESKDVALKVEKKDIGYYNVLLKQWVTEQGQYEIYVGSSSRDIRLEKTISIDSHTPYSIDQVGNTMLG